MKTGLFGALLGCGAVFAWAWSARPCPADLEFGAISPRTVPRPLLAQPVALGAARNAQPALAATMTEVPFGPPAQVAMPEVPPPASGANAERIARRLFHARIVVEDLERLLPSEETSDPRTRENFPGLFAAIDQRDEIGAQFSSLPPPTEHEPLPALDLGATPADFDRIYRDWSREDLLVENWRIGRFAHAESKRLLEKQFELLGPYRTENSPAPGLFG